MYDQLSEGKWHRGRPKKRFKDSLKDSLHSLGIPHDTWETLATEKSTWRSTVCTGAQRAEEKRIAIATQKRVTKGLTKPSVYVLYAVLLSRSSSNLMDEQYNEYILKTVL